jgi:hypothetical protein
MIDQNERIHALPATDEYRSALFADRKLVKNESMGVPRLGDTSLWEVNTDAGLERDGFKDWKRVYDSHYGDRMQDAEKQAFIEETDKGMRTAPNALPEEPTLAELEEMYRLSKSTDPVPEFDLEESFRGVMEKINAPKKDS